MPGESPAREWIGGHLTASLSSSTTAPSPTTPPRHRHLDGTARPPGRGPSGPCPRRQPRHRRDAIRIADHNLADQSACRSRWNHPRHQRADPRARLPVPGPRRFRCPPPARTNPATSRTRTRRARTRRGRWSPPAIPSSPSRSTLADDNQILRLDIPALGVDGVCLSIIGQLGQNRGVLIFLSREDFKQFIEAAAKSDTSWAKRSLPPATTTAPSRRHSHR